MLPGPHVTVGIASLCKCILGAKLLVSLAVGSWFDTSPIALEILKEFHECGFRVLSNLTDIFGGVLKITDGPLDFLFKAWLFIS